jgi:type I restriction enzyme S subunit
MSNKIPTDWENIKIEECCHILDSMRVPINSQERDKRKGKYPYYGANGIQGMIDDYIFEGEAVLVAEDGGNFDQYATRPIAQFVTGKYWVNNHAHILKAKECSTSKWIFYSLVHKNILSSINGGTRAKLNQSDLRQIEIALPSLKEQKKITAILTSVDEVIENTQAQIAKLEDLKRAMMNELLTKGIGHTEFKETEIGRVPKSWTIKTLKEILKEPVGGVSVNSENKRIKSFEIGVLKTSCISSGKFYANENKRVISEDIYRVKTSPKQNSIIFSRMNTPNLVGESGYISQNHKNLYLPDRLWLLEIKNKSEVDTKWLSIWMSSENTKKTISERATGTSGSMKNISQPSLLSIAVAIPPLIEQSTIKHSISSIEEKIDSLTYSLKKCNDLKRALMQDLLTGKVRVSVN